MADITATLNACLKERGARSVRRKDYNLSAINLFLQEAYSINARIAELTRELRAIRPEYLSDAPAAQQRQQQRRRIVEDGSDHALANGHSNTSERKRPLTNTDREAIDTNAKQLLRELNGAINALKQAEEIRLQAADSVALSKRARGGLGALGRWAAGGAVTAKSPEEELEEAARKTVAAVRESVIVYLQRKLEEAGRVQSSMMDQRLSKEVQKSRSVLSQSAAAGIIPHLRHTHDSNPNPSPSSQAMHTTSKLAQNRDSKPTLEAEQQDLTPEQLQLFEQENHELLRHYEAQLDQIKTAEKSILEISELHSTLHANLQQQSEHIDQLVQDSFLTTENLGKGNKELKRASERRSTAQAIFYSTVAFCSFLVIWDLAI